MTQEFVLRRPRRRRWPWAAVLLATMLTLGWSVLWLVAQRQAVLLTDGWFAAEAAQGRTWSCPERVISGFPFSFDLSCANPVFTARLGGQPLRGQLAGLTAHTDLMHVNAVHIEPRAPLTLRTDDGSDVADVTWTKLVVEVGLTLTATVRAGLEADRVDVAMPDRAGLHLERGSLAVAQSGSDGRTYDVTVALTGAGLPELDDVTGDAARLDLHAAAAVSALEIAGVQPWRTIVERWRAAGGRLTIQSLDAGKGALRLEAQGQLGLDDQHRVSGVLQSTVTGYAPVAERLGLPIGAVSLGGALAGLLNGTARVPAPAAGTPAALTLPVAFREGRLAIGPFRTAVRLAPLY